MRLSTQVTSMPSQPEQTSWDRLLTLVNAGALLCLLLNGATGIGLIFAVAAFLVLWAASGVIQVGVAALARRVRMPLAARALLFTLPAWLLAGLVAIRPMLPQPVNQRSPSASPNNAFVLRVPVEGGLWRVTIRDKQTGAVYKDDAEFIGQLNVYWIWDRESRVWLLNSDTSAVYFWEQHAGAWTRTRWGYGHTREIRREIQPPEALYPPSRRSKSEFTNGRNDERRPNVITSVTTTEFHRL